MTAGIFISRPQEPLQYMIDEIEKLQELDRRRKGVIKKTAQPDKPTGHVTETSSIENLQT